MSDLARHHKATLKVLHLANNELTALPKEIGNLKNLDTLVLRDNKLSALPEEIGKLSSLKHLHLQGNKLEVLPITLAKTALATQNATLLLYGNPLNPNLAAFIDKAGIIGLVTLMANAKTYQDLIGRKDQSDESQKTSSEAGQKPATVERKKSVGSLLGVKKK
ncbi:hypothetical protein HDU96_008904 [Phlyctochytrium bullatum]|nr:hypothetical protein HDU96_008904 [Phlyctochytrium bullatum]